LYKYSQAFDCSILTAGRVIAMHKAYQGLARLLCLVFLLLGPHLSLADATSAIKLSQQDIRDPGMNNIVSHTLLVPEGWTLQGEPGWTPGLKPFVHHNFGVHAPDGRAVWFLPGHTYSYADIPPQLAQMMAMQGQQVPAPGTPQADGSIWNPPPRDISEFLLRDLLPRGRPNAGNVRATRVEHLREIEQVVEAMLAPMLQVMDQGSAWDAQLGMRQDRSLRVESVTLEYDEDGTRFREDVAVMLSMHWFQSPDMSGMGLPPMMQYSWFAMPLVAARAPAEAYEANEALFIAVASSLRPTLEWQTRVDEIQRQIMEAEHRSRMASIQEFGRIQSEIARTNREISDMQRSSYEERMASQDRMSRSFSNATLGVDDYRTPDGSSVSLPSDYNHVYTDNHGSYVLSNDPHFDPNRHDSRGGWQSIEPVRPMGGAANE
jgi:hypothetical protein